MNNRRSSSLSESFQFPIRTKNSIGWTLIITDVCVDGQRRLGIMSKDISLIHRSSTIDVLITDLIEIERRKSLLNRQRWKTQKGMGLWHPREEMIKSISTLSACVSQCESSETCRFASVESIDDNEDNCNRFSLLVNSSVWLSVATTSVCSMVSPAGNW